MPIVQPKTAFCADMYISATRAMVSRGTPAPASISLHEHASICCSERREPFGVAGDEVRLVALALEDVLRDAGEQRKITADMRLHVEAGDAAAEQQAAGIAGHAKVHQTDFFGRVDDDDVAAAPPQRHQACAAGEDGSTPDCRR